MDTGRTIHIDPITRLEGHGKVAIFLDEEGEVRDARFHITQFRGFERFCRGRPMEEMPVITQRICGICPISHQLAAAKACDAILDLEIPPAAVLLRRLAHMGQFIQSHALHFFYLASPDLLLGWDADPAVRNVVGVLRHHPEIARRGIGLRRWGQEMIQAVGGKRIHPALAVPGGVIAPLDPARRDALQAGLAEAYATADMALALIGEWTEAHRAEAAAFARFDSLYTGLVDTQGRSDLYDGQVRIRRPDGTVAAQFAPSDYLSFIAEHVESWSYLKFPYFRPEGYPAGSYRVGPLARLAAADALATPRAQAALEDFRARTAGDLAGGSLLYHWARMVELLQCIEAAEALLADARLCDREVRRTAAARRPQGIGIIEAPRGTLIHHYQVDGHGAITDVNLIVATGHNNAAMNRAVTLVARQAIRPGTPIAEGACNRVEGAIRCYDPCLSCSTHCLDQTATPIEVRDARGRRCWPGPRR